MAYLEIKSPIYSTGEMMDVFVKEIIYDKKSAFQQITIADTVQFGRSLLIDGIMQGTEKDYEIYDREMLKLLDKKAERILVLGGGDGSLAEVALKTDANLKVCVIELDSEVIMACEKYLGQNIFAHPNVELCIGNALDHLESAQITGNIKYDGILCDLTDTPMGCEKSGDFERFYERLISLAFSVLKDDGWISIQAGASSTHEKHIDAAFIIENTLTKYFPNTTRSDIAIPSFGEDVAFLFGQKH
jgi:spermidine synthase